VDIDLSASGRLIFVGRALRAFAFGWLSVVLALYLAERGFSPAAIGAVFTATMVEDALLTMALSAIAGRVGPARVMAATAPLMALGGVLLATADSRLLLLAGAVLGTLSPNGQDAGPFAPLEQALLPATVRRGPVVRVFGWYNVCGFLPTALGAAAAGGALGAALARGVASLQAQRLMLFVYAALALALTALYLVLAARAPEEQAPVAPAAPRTLGLGRSRSVVLQLAGLQGLDALAGGFIMQSLLAYWFHVRFGVGPEALGALFFGTNLLSALSFLAAARIAERVGLLNTMVFTHLPSNLLLLAVPFMPTFGSAAALLLARHVLSQMDVPTRQAFTVALVPPEERAAAAGFPGSVRALAQSAAPSVAGVAMGAAAGPAPFVLAGGLKIVYDLCLYFRFRSVRLDKPALVLAALLAAPLAAQASNVGRRFPSEKRTVVDEATGATLEFLTTDPASDAKPYQTHTTWTADGRWVIFRSDRAGSGPQAFLVDERTGDIVQVTDGPTDTGSLNLSRKENVLYFARGGRRGGGPETPRQLVRLQLDPLLADALAGTPRDAAVYERVVATLPSDLRDAGGFALDADESQLYWGVGLDPAPAPAPRPAPAAGGRREIDDRNMDPRQDREESRRRFAEAGKGRGGIRSIDPRTGAVRTVVDVPFRMGHVQANPWVPGEIVYCHETTGDAPQRIWTVRADGTGNRPLYVERGEEWVTHETFATADEVMFALMGHLPWLRERPTGVAVVNLRTNHMTILGQIDEDMGGGRTGGFWHCNGTADGRLAVADSFKGDVYLIDRRTGARTLLTGGHVMKPDHAHPIFSADGTRVLLQSGRLTGGASLDLVVVAVPPPLLGR
jgi:MFS family permease